MELIRRGGNNITRARVIEVSEAESNRVRPAATANSSMKLSIANTFMCAPSERNAEIRTGICRRK